MSDDIDETSRIIIASYIEGLDSMALKGRRETIRRAYQRIEPKLPGSLILEEESETIIKIATSEVNVNLNEILSSMSSMLNSMFERLVATWRITAIKISRNCWKWTIKWTSYTSLH